MEFQNTPQILVTCRLQPPKQRLSPGTLPWTRTCSSTTEHRQFQRIKRYVVLKKLNAKLFLHKEQGELVIDVIVIPYRPVRRYV